VTGVVTAGVVALAGITFVVAVVASLVDVVRRTDLTLRRRVAWGAAVVVAPAYAGILYGLTRPLPVRRVVVGAPAGPVVDERHARTPGARFVQQIAQLATVGLFRSVEVVRPASVSSTGPQLWIASHFGAFSDAIVLLHALERHPRFLAGDFLFRVPLLRQLLRLAAAIPVRRSADRPKGGDNRGMFAASREALAAGNALAVFPEGVATDGPAISPLRTGAARIALGAVADGVRGIQVVPVGIHYQDRAAFRSRVFVDVGEPVDLDGWLADHGTDRQAVSDGDHDLVRSLTDDLEVQLRAVAPQFTDLEEAVALHTAARVALRARLGRTPDWGLQADLADDLGTRSADERRELLDAVRTYQAGLDAVGLGDADVLERPARSRRRILLQLAAGLLLLPFAVAGAVVHAPLVALVTVLRSLRISPPTKASLLPAVSLLGALVTWFGWAWVLTATESGTARVGAVLALVLVFPLWGVAALLLVERVSLALRALRSVQVRRRGRRSDAVDELRAERARLLELVEAAPGLGASPATGEPSGLT
jgi:glycerol-3-phosphate O-acyltransferase / dihydroxyacetone phosphate acyltransferase